ncbi:hypothetical protein B0A48_14360 [Cryoendolithus antarcticus]|uniref:Uncharacterized protein n=1 Tax=Cryoendolithus antarcticus TaxID=1507870 RepID=A0A1V8SJX2_9PEZI|nr:hypothetical protein B0A48_14360 [Cryoendolithus antarcticus]
MPDLASSSNVTTGQSPEPTNEVLRALQLIQQNLVVLARNQKTIVRRIDALTHTTEEAQLQMAQEAVDVATVRRDIAEVRHDQAAQESSLLERLALLEGRLDDRFDELDVVNEATAAPRITAGGSTVSVHFGGNALPGHRRIDY